MGDPSKATFRIVSEGRISADEYGIEYEGHVLDKQGEPARGYKYEIQDGHGNLIEGPSITNERGEVEGDAILKLREGVQQRVQLVCLDTDVKVALQVPSKKESTKRKPRQQREAPRVKVDEVPDLRGGKVIKSGESLTLRSGLHKVESELIVEEGGILIMEKGATMEFKPAAGIVCRGVMKADGATFKGAVDNKMRWSNITFEGPGVRGSELINCIVEGGGGRNNAYQARLRAGKHVTLRRRVDREIEKERIAKQYYRVAENGETVVTGSYGGGILIRETLQGDRTCVKLQDVTLRNNNASHGGGLCIMNASPEVDNVIMEGNLAVEEGGGIMIANDEAGDTDRKTEVKSGGGEIYLGAQNSCLLRGMSATHNRAKHGGGIYVRKGVVEIENGEIKHNSALEEGGGMRLDQGEFSLYDTEVSDNSAGNGGGVRLGEAEMKRIRDFSVHNNTARETGGGIYSEEALFDEHEELRHASIYDNEPRDVAMTNLLEERKREAEAQKRREEAERVRTLFRSMCDGKNVMKKDDVLVVEKGEHEVRGRLHVPVGATLELKPGVVLKFKEKAGVLCRGKLIAQGVEDDKIMFRTDGDHWGSIKLEGEGIDGSLLEHCYVSGGVAVNGGGIAVEYGKKAEVSFKNVDIESCKAENGGGMFIKDSRRVNLEEVNVRGNTAKAGGGIYMDRSKVSAKLLKVEGNKAIGDAEKSNGGGVYISSSKLEEKGSIIIERNEAEHRGGGIFICRENEEYMGTHLNQVKIRENKAEYGGGVAYFQSEISINNGVIEGNIARGDGAAIIIDIKTSPNTLIRTAGIASITTIVGMTAASILAGGTGSSCMGWCIGLPVYIGGMAYFGWELNGKEELIEWMNKNFNDSRPYNFFVMPRVDINNTKISGNIKEGSRVLEKTRLFLSNLFGGFFQRRSIN